MLLLNEKKSILVRKPNVPDEQRDRGRQRRAARTYICSMTSLRNTPSTSVMYSSRLVPFSSAKGPNVRTWNAIAGWWHNANDEETNEWQANKNQRLPMWREGCAWTSSKGGRRLRSPFYIRQADIGVAPWCQNRWSPTPQQLPEAEGLSCSQPAPFSQRGANAAENPARRLPGLTFLLPTAACPKGRPCVSRPLYRRPPATCWRAGRQEGKNTGSLPSSRDRASDKNNGRNQPPLLGRRSPACSPGGTAPNPEPPVLPAAAQWRSAVTPPSHPARRPHLAASPFPRAAVPRPPRPRRRPPRSRITAASPQPAAPLSITRALLPPAGRLQRMDPSARRSLRRSARVPSSRRPPLEPPLLDGGAIWRGAGPRRDSCGRARARSAWARARPLRRGASIGAAPLGGGGGRGGRRDTREEKAVGGGDKKGGSRERLCGEKKWGMKRFLRRGGKRGLLRRGEAQTRPRRLGM